jgi:hypothetical protein
MNRDLATWVGRIVAAAVMAGAGAVTMGALGVTGAFDSRVAPVMVPVSPVYQAVDRAIDRRESRQPIDGVRDPFTFRVPARAPSLPRLAARPEPAPVESNPILTAIVWDNDPRALVRWKDREWTIREGGLFDEFQVVSITRDEVRLLRGEAAIVLQRRKLGE